MAKPKRVTVTGVIPTAVAGKGETVTVNNTARIQALIEAGYLSTTAEETTTADVEEDE